MTKPSSDWEWRFEEECPLIWGAREWAKAFIREIAAQERQAGAEEKQLVIDMARENLEACLILMPENEERRNLFNNVFEVLARTPKKP